MVPIKKLLIWSAALLLLFVLPPYWRGVLVGIILCRAYYELRRDLEVNVSELTRTLTSSDSAEERDIKNELGRWYNADNKNVEP